MNDTPYESGLDDWILGNSDWDLDFVIPSLATQVQVGWGENSLSADGTAFLGFSGSKASGQPDSHLCSSQAAPTSVLPPKPGPAQSMADSVPPCAALPLELAVPDFEAFEGLGLDFDLANLPMPSPLPSPRRSFERDNGLAGSGGSAVQAEREVAPQTGTRTSAAGPGRGPAIGLGLVRAPSGTTGQGSLQPWDPAFWKGAPQHAAGYSKDRGSGSIGLGGGGGALAMGLGARGGVVPPVARGTAAHALGAKHATAGPRAVSPTPVLNARFRRNSAPSAAQVSAALEDQGLGLGLGPGLGGSKAAAGSYIVGARETEAERAEKDVAIDFLRSVMSNARKQQSQSRRRGLSPVERTGRAQARGASRSRPPSSSPAGAGQLGPRRHVDVEHAHVGLPPLPQIPSLQLTVSDPGDIDMERLGGELDLECGVGVGLGLGGLDDFMMDDIDFEWPTMEGVNFELPDWDPSFGGPFTGLVHSPEEAAAMDVSGPGLAAGFVAARDGTSQKPRLQKLRFSSRPPAGPPNSGKPKAAVPVIDIVAEEPPRSPSFYELKPRKQRQVMAIPESFRQMKAVLGNSVRRQCVSCGLRKSPQWRSGPAEWGDEAYSALCNRCGVMYRSGRFIPERKFPAIVRVEPIVRGPRGKTQAQGGSGSLSPEPRRPYAAASHADLQASAHVNVALHVAPTHGIGHLQLQLQGAESPARAAASLALAYEIDGLLLGEPDAAAVGTGRGSGGLSLAGLGGGLRSAAEEAPQLVYRAAAVVDPFQMATSPMGADAAIPSYADAPWGMPTLNGANYGLEVGNLASGSGSDGQGSWNDPGLDSGFGGALGLPPLPKVPGPGGDARPSAGTSATWANVDAGLIL